MQLFLLIDPYSASVKMVSDGWSLMDISRGPVPKPLVLDHDCTAVKIRSMQDLFIPNHPTRVDALLAHSRQGAMTTRSVVLG